MADTSVNVKVVVRCRPMNGKEREKDCKKIVKISERDGTVELHNTQLGAEEDDGLPKAFKFDYVYDDTSLQRVVYDEIAYPLVESVIEGYNGAHTVFRRVAPVSRVW